MPELNPSAQRCLPRFFTGILIFKGLTARRLYKSFSVKGLTLKSSAYAERKWQNGSQAMRYGVQGGRHEAGETQRKFGSA
jgi:hypothetical protein